MRSEIGALFFVDGCCEEDYRFHESTHFLETCFLCQKPLPHNSDIFMYRGNTAFCSEECRQEQIHIDKAKKRRFSSSTSSKSKTKINASFNNQVQDQDQDQTSANNNISSPSSRSRKDLRSTTATLIVA